MGEVGVKGCFSDPEPIFTPEREASNMKKIFRLGAIGTGNIFTGAHVPAYVDLHDAIAVDGKLIKREEAAEATRRVIM